MVEQMKVDGGKDEGWWWSRRRWSAMWRIALNSGSRGQMTKNNRLLEKMKLGLF